MKLFHIANILCVCACLGLLGACATKNVVSGSASVFGVGGQTRPDGTAQAAIGAVTGDFVTVPLVTDQADGSQGALRVRDACGQEDAVSVYGSITGNSAAGVGGGPSVSLNVGRALATGEAARLLTSAILASAPGATAPGFAPLDCSRVIPNPAR